MPIPVQHCLVFSSVLFLTGVVGFLVRRNLLVVLMSMELMLNAVNLNLVAFSARLSSPTGQVMAIFIITVAAAEAAVGLAILVSVRRNQPGINKDEFHLMKG